MTQVTIPRTFGGTLILDLTIVPPAPVTIEPNILVRVRKGSVTMNARKGTIMMRVRETTS